MYIFVIHASLSLYEDGYTSITSITNDVIVSPVTVTKRRNNASGPSVTILPFHLFLCASPMQTAAFSSGGIVDGDEACGLLFSWPLLQSVVVLMPLQKAIR